MLINEHVFNVITRCQEAVDGNQIDKVDASNNLQNAVHNLKGDVPSLFQEQQDFTTLILHASAKYPYRNNESEKQIICLLSKSFLKDLGCPLLAWFLTSLRELGVTRESPIGLKLALRILKQIIFDPESDIPQITEDWIVHEGSSLVRQRTNSESSLKEFANLLVLLPIKVSSACFSLRCQIPLWCTRQRYPPALVSRLLQDSIRVNNNQINELLRLTIVQLMHHGASTEVVVGLLSVWSSMDDKQAYSEAVGRIISNNNPGSCMTQRDLMNLSRLILQRCSTTKCIIGFMHDTINKNIKSDKFWEDFAQFILFGNSIKFEDVPKLLLDLLPAKSVKSILSKVATIWSDSLYISRTPTNQQHYVTDFLVFGLKCIDPCAEDQDFALPVVMGVSARLESSLDGVRIDGMKVAQALAPLLGQEVEFEELHKEEVKNAEPADTSVFVTPEEVELPDNDSSTSSVWDEDDLIPFDLNDDEEDLKEAQRPLYLRDCLRMLRTMEDDEFVASKHEEALKAASTLIRSRPIDLVDLAIPLTKELLHLENKFDIRNFTEMSFDALTALAVCEPLSVSKLLISIVFESSVSTGTRIEILDVLSFAAMELSGIFELQKSRDHEGQKLLQLVTQKVSGKRQLVREPLKDENVTEVNQKIRRWGSPRGSTLSVENMFAPLVAPLFFYPLVKVFVISKSESSIWSRGDGARLMAKVILTLSCFVQSAGVLSAPILARDLLSLVWEFSDAESPVVRQAVLVAIATCQMVLSQPDILHYIVMQLPGLPAFLTSFANLPPDQNKGRDEDDSCRKLAVFVLTHIQTSIQDSMTVLPQTLTHK